jgi:hypothetical protein
LLRNVRENGMKKPWQKMTEGEQRLEIERATDKADELIQEVVDIIASGDFPVVHAIIDNYQSKNGEVKIVAKGVADDEVILNLHHAGKKPVKIVIADRNQFDQTRTNLEPDPDEPGLPGVKQELGLDDMTGGAFEDEDDDDDAGGEVEEPAAFDDATEQAQGDDVLKPKSDQWRGGFNSRMAGHFRNENPFDAATQTQQNTDWFDGWDAGDFDDRAPKLDADTVPTTPVEGTAGDNGADELPQVDDEPADETEEQRDISSLVETDEGEVLPTDEEIEEVKADGRAARKDGQSPKKNPHPKDNWRNQAWQDGYLEAKAAEAKDKPADAPFDD